MGIPVRCAVPSFLQWSGKGFLRIKELKLNLHVHFQNTLNCCSTDVLLLIRQFCRLQKQWCNANHRIRSYNRSQLLQTVMAVTNRCNVFYRVPWIQPQTNWASNETRPLDWKLERHMSASTGTYLNEDAKCRHL